MKVKYDEPLSNAAFNFNVRRYTAGDVGYFLLHDLVGRCRLTRLTASKPELKARLVSAINQRLKLKCDEPLSNVAFNVNVRHYDLEVKCVHPYLYDEAQVVGPGMPATSSSTF